MTTLVATWFLSLHRTDSDVTLDAGTLVPLRTVFGDDPRWDQDQDPFAGPQGHLSMTSPTSNVVESKPTSALLIQDDDVDTPPSFPHPATTAHVLLRSPLDSLR